jgi:hypothetical protein
VFLDVAHGGEALCPYCGTQYVYKGAPVKGTRLPRILVVAPNWIGDALMAQPLLARCTESSGHASTCSRPPGSRRSRAACPRCRGDRGAASPRRLQTRRPLAPRRAAGERGYDQAIVLPNSWKSALVPFFAGIPRAAATSASRATAC